MSLDLTGLTAYTDENKMDLVRASIMGGKTIKKINIQAGIKSSAEINLLSTTAVWAAGSCGWSAAGSTLLTQRTLTVGSIKKNEAICVEDLEAYWIQTQLKAGSFQEEIPFEQQYSEELTEQTADMLETLAWQGDTGGAGNLVFADGFIKIIDAASDEVRVVTGVIDSSNIIANVDAMVAAIPADVIASGDLTLWMGFDLYRTYAAALRTANLFHYDGSEGADFEMVIPGTNITVVATKGLNTVGRMCLAEDKNLFFGTDLLGEEEAFRIFYSEDNDEVRVNQKFKAGFQTAFTDRIVISHPTA